MKTTNKQRLFSWTAIVSLLATLSPAGLYAAAERSGIEGKVDGILIITTPPSGTAVYAVEEALPPDAFPRRISHDGFFDPHSNKVKWGPFYDDLPRDLTFELSIAQGAGALSGNASFDDSGSLPTNGITAIELPDAETYFAGWQNRHLPVDVSLFSPDYVAPGSIVPLLAQYAMGQAPGESVSPFQITLLENGQHELRYARDVRRSDVSVQLEASENLSDWIPWSPSSAQSEALNEHTDAIRVPAEEADRYYRVRVTIPEAER